MLVYKEYGQLIFFALRTERFSRSIVIATNLQKSLSMVHSFTLDFFSAVVALLSSFPSKQTLMSRLLCLISRWADNSWVDWTITVGTIHKYLHTHTHMYIFSQRSFKLFTTHCNFSRCIFRFVRVFLVCLFACFISVSGNAYTYDNS